MIYYHGTVEAYLPSIEKEGLKTIPAHRYHARGFHMGFGLEDGLMPIRSGVYVVDSKRWAKKFAQYKAAWLASPPGLVVTGDKPDSQTFHLYKVVASQLIQTTPVVLTLDLSDSIVRNLNPDNDGDSDHMFWYPGVIPPTAIQSVDHVPALPFQTLQLKEAYL
jgi:hypothetical protein